MSAVRNVGEAAHALAQVQQPVIAKINGVAPDDEGDATLATALERVVTVFKAGVGYDRQALLDLVRGLIGYR